jgi:hypothetical protein
MSDDEHPPNRAVATFIAYLILAIIGAFLVYGGVLLGWAFMRLVEWLTAVGSA